MFNSPRFLCSSTVTNYALAHPEERVCCQKPLSCELPGCFSFAFQSVSNSTDHPSERCGAQQNEMVQLCDSCFWTIKDQELADQQNLIPLRDKGESGAIPGEYKGSGILEWVRKHPYLAISFGAILFGGLGAGLGFGLATYFNSQGQSDSIRSPNHTAPPPSDQPPSDHPPSDQPTANYPASAHPASAHPAADHPASTMHSSASPCTVTDTDVTQSATKK